MISYDELKMRLLKSEDARQSPLDEDAFNESLLKSKRIDEKNLIKACIGLL